MNKNILQTIGKPLKWIACGFGVTLLLATFVYGFLSYFIMTVNLDTKIKQDGLGRIISAHNDHTFLDSIQDWIVIGGGTVLAINLIGFGISKSPSHSIPQPSRQSTFKDTFSHTSNIETILSQHLPEDGKKTIHEMMKKN